jgi:ABC-type lipoprotein export system ATPase subunit
MIHTHHLEYSYSSPQVFHYPDLCCSGGEKLLIKGKSGCGKTTLLHLLSGVLTPSAGSIVVDGTDITSLSESARDAFRGQNIGIVPQRFHFIQSISIEDNIRASAFFSGKSIDANKLLQITDYLGIKKILSRKPAQLSPGEQQRVCVARAIIHSPKILLADEPTSSLDDDNCSEVIRLLDGLASEFQTALIVVTHDQRLETYFDRQIHLL